MKDEPPEEKPDTLAKYRDKEDINPDYDSDLSNWFGESEEDYESAARKRAKDDKCI